MMNENWSIQQKNPFPENSVSPPTSPQLSEEQKQLTEIAKQHLTQLQLDLAKTSEKSTTRSIKTLQDFTKNEHPKLSKFLRSTAKKDLSLAETFLTIIEQFEARSISLEIIEEAILSLENPVNSFSSSMTEEVEKKNLLVEGIKYFHQLIKKEIKSDILENYLRKTSIFISNNLASTSLPILKTINEGTLQSQTDICESILLENLYSDIEIKEYLLKKTASNDFYYIIYDQPWNVSAWPEITILGNIAYKKTLKKVLILCYQNEGLPELKDDLVMLNSLSSSNKKTIHTIFKAIQQKEEPIKTIILNCINNCETFKQLVGIVAIIKKDVEAFSAIQHLPKPLQLTLFSKIELNSVKHLKDVFKLDFPLQAYFIFLLSNENLYRETYAAYLNKSELFDKYVLFEKINGQPLRSLLNLENASEIIDILLENPFLRKILRSIQKNSLFEGENQVIKNLSTIILNGKKEWISKLSIICENNPDLFEKILKYLQSTTKFPKWVDMILDERIDKIQSLKKQLLELSEKIFFWPDQLDVYPNRGKIDTGIETLINYILKEDSDIELTTKLLKEFPYSHKMGSVLFINDIEKINQIEQNIKHLSNSNKEEKSILLSLAKIDVTILDQLLSQNITIITSSKEELIKNFLNTYSKEIQAKVEELLESWNVNNDPFTIKQLKDNEISFLFNLLKLANKDKNKFSIIATLAQEFPLPLGEKLLYLQNLNVHLIENFKNFIKNYSERGAWLLNYLSNEIKNQRSVHHLLNQAGQEKLLKAFNTENPKEALESFSIEIIPAQRQSSFSNIFFLLQTSKNLEKIESLIKQQTSRTSIQYLVQLGLLEIQEYSVFVSDLLNTYPKHTYPFLVSIALEGYEREAHVLFKRLQIENPLTPLTKKICQAMESSVLECKEKGQWLAIALKLNQIEHRPLIDFLISRIEIGKIELHTTFLINGKKETLNRIISAFQKENNTENSLLEWVSNGNLSFVEWICHEDLQNSDPQYKNLRSISPFNLQEKLLILYRDMSDDPTLQKACLSFILNNQEQDRTTSIILYLHAHETQWLKENLAQLDLSQIETKYLESLSSLPINNEIIIQTSTKLDETLEALSQQWHFAVSSAEILINRDGSINTGMIKEIKQSPFFIKNQYENTTVYIYLDWIFKLLQSNGEFSERLLRHATIPTSESPAHTLILQTLKKAEDKSLTKRDVQIAILSCLLQRPWQSPNVGSCFGTSIIIQAQSTESLILQTLDDYLLLTQNNCLERKIDNTSHQYPLSKTAVENLYEHPFTKAREYCIASMAATGSSKSLKLKNLDELFAHEEGIISLYLEGIARKDKETYTEIYILKDELKQQFMEQTLEIYDPLLKTNEDVGTGGWILINKATFEPITTEKKYEAFLYELINGLKNDHQSAQKNYALKFLTQKILNHEIIEELKNHFTNSLPWTKSAGGSGDICKKIYFEELHRKALISSEKNFECDLRAIYTYAKSLSSSESFKRSQEKFLCTFHGHDYNLIRNQLSLLRNFNSFDELILYLRTNASLADLNIDSKIGEKWISSIGSLLSESDQKNFFLYLKKHPIEELPLQKYGERLIDILLRIDIEKSERSPFIVEQSILNLEEIHNKKPYHVIVGDYNWFNKNQNAWFAAYAISPLTSKIQPYGVTENGKNMLPSKQSKGINISEPLKEYPWKPF